MKTISKITILLFGLLALANVAAYANDSTNFKLILVDQNGVRVITNNVGNILTGDGNPALDTIDYSGRFDGTLYSISIRATSKLNADGTGALTLSGQVGCNGSTGCTQLKIFLEDDGFTTPSTPTTFIAGVQGYDAVHNLPLPNISLVGTGTSLGVQSWIGTGNSEPVTAAAGNYAPFIPVIPADGVAEFSAAPLFNAASANLFATSSPGITPNFGVSPLYSEFVEADFTFPSTSGSVNFSLNANTPNANAASVPEPTSLLLLGSALLGFGVLRKKVS